MQVTNDAAVTPSVLFSHVFIDFVRRRCGSLSRDLCIVMLHVSSLSPVDVEERDGGRTGETLPEGAAHPSVQRHRVQVGSAGPRSQLPAQQSQVCQAQEQSQGQGQLQL